jgi:hypothetical protein
MNLKFEKTELKSENMNTANHVEGLGISWRIFIVLFLVYFTKQSNLGYLTSNEWLVENTEIWDVKRNFRALTLDTIPEST